MNAWASQLVGAVCNGQASLALWRATCLKEVRISQISVVLFRVFKTAGTLSHKQSTTGFPLTYVLTYSMVQSPSWEANWSAASQETPRISRNSMVHYRTHKRPPPVSILGQPNPVHSHCKHKITLSARLGVPRTCNKFHCVKNERERTAEKTA